jgi:hypothetical protein
MVKFSECMRSHGVPNFPDPVNGVISGSAGSASGSGFDPRSSQFTVAQQACKALIPAGRQSGGPDAGVQSQALKFAHCMRSHGVKNFPDPTVSGNAIGSQLPPDVAANSPQFKSAQQTCQSLLTLGRGGGQ